MTIRTVNCYHVAGAQIEERVEGASGAGFLDIDAGAGRARSNSVYAGFQGMTDG